MHLRLDAIVMGQSSPGGRGAACLTAVLALTMCGASTENRPAVTPAVAATNQVAKVVLPPQSIFIDEVGQGKDPFFPNSTRREQPGKTPATVQMPTVLDQLVLKGITGTKTRRFAIINHEVFGVGEEYELTLAGQRIKVCCEQINETSVVISVRGQPNKMELKLRQF